MSLNKYLVFSRDPGGAEILSRLIKNEKIQDDCLFILEGPAKQIFLHVLGSLECIGMEEVETLFFKFKIQKIFCSTSGHEGPEKFALKTGKAFQVETVTVIDHWTNFPERFSIQESKEVILPQIIYYSDEIQADLLRLFVKSETKLVKIPNYYLEDLKQDFDLKIKAADKGNTVLLLDEPLKDDSRELSLEDHGYDEYSAFRFFLENVNKACPKCETVIIRLHPRSLKHKYDKIMDEYPNLKIEYSSNANLVDDLIRVKSAHGCTTMALIVSAFCNVETFSIIPVKDVSHGLPSNKIKYLRDLK